MAIRIFIMPAAEDAGCRIVCARVEAAGLLAKSVSIGQQQTIGLNG
jgi:hypothetical protein